MSLRFMLVSVKELLNDAQRRAARRMGKAYMNGANEQTYYSSMLGGIRNSGLRQD